MQLLPGRIARQDVFRTHGAFLDDAGLTIDYLATRGLLAHCPTELPCPPPHIAQCRHTEHDDDGKYHHREDESQDQQDDTGKSGKQVSKHVDLSTFRSSRREHEPQHGCSGSSGLAVGVRQPCRPRQQATEHRSKYAQSASIHGPFLVKRSPAPRSAQRFLCHANLTALRRMIQGDGQAIQRASGNYRRRGVLLSIGKRSAPRAIYFAGHSIEFSPAHD